MIAAVVPELQLVGLAAQGDSHELMSQTDAEDRLSSHKASDVVHGVGARLGIARAIGQEHAIRLQSQDIFGLGLGRNDSDLAAFAAQLAQRSEERRVGKEGRAQWWTWGSK